MPLLTVSGLTHFFGGLRAVHDYHVSIDKGEILLEGEDIAGLPPHRIASRGLGRGPSRT